MSEFNETNLGEDVVSGVDTVKKGKGGKIAAGVAAGVVVLGAAGGAVAYGCSDFVKNQVKLRFSKPASYYSWVTEKNSNDLSTAVADVYSEYIDNVKNGTSSSVSVRYDISDDAKTLVKNEIFGSDADDMDGDTKTYVDLINGLSSIAIGADATSKGGVSGSSFYASINDDRLVTMDSVIDSASLDSFFRIPELTERWIGVKGTLTAAASSGVTGTSDILDAYKKALQDPESLVTADEIKKELDRYIGVWNSTFDDVTIEKKEDVTIGDITVSYTVAEITIDEVKAKELAENMVTCAKEDELLRSVLVDRVKAVKADEFDEAMKEALDSVKEENFGEGKVVLKTYIDAKGGIRGIDLIEDEEEGNEILAVIGKSGDEIRGEAYFMDGGNKDFEMIMNAAENNKKASGTVECRFDDTKVTVEFKDVETVDEKKGYLSGTYTINVPEIDPISIAFDSDGKSQKISSQIVISGTDFGKVTVEYAYGDKASAPTEVDKDNALILSEMNMIGFDLSDYVEEEKMSGFVNDVLTKIGFDKDAAQELADMAVSGIYDGGNILGGGSSFGDLGLDSDHGLDHDFDHNFNEDFDLDLDIDNYDFSDLDFGADFDDMSLFNKAYLYVVDSNFGATFYGAFGTMSDGAVLAKLEGDGEYTVSVKAPSNVKPSGFSILSLNVDQTDLLGDPDVKIKSIKIDGKEIALTGNVNVAKLSKRFSVPLFTKESFAFGETNNVIDGDSIGDWNSIEVTFDVTGLKK